MVLRRALPKLPAPVILTARHPAEGGEANLGVAQRRALFAELMPFAAWIDIERRSVKELALTLAEARDRGIKVIISSHDFAATPPARSLSYLVRSARKLGADVCKIATLTSTPADLAALLALVTRPQPLPLSVMGMGRFGKISRLLLAACGSRLNYGYLDQPNASGQWPAVLLKKRLQELGEA